MKNLLILLTAFIVPIFYTGIVKAQNQPVPAQPQAASDEFDLSTFTKDSSQQKLEFVLVDNFENSDAWTAAMPPDQGLARAKKVLGAPSDVKSKASGQGQYCLGVKEWCYKRGFNWTDVKPPVPIEITGKIKALSIWAWGGNVRHRLEIWVKNYQGIEYAIDMGSLNFRGWKRLIARIPMFIPYYTKYVPQYKSMYITRIIVRHDPNEMHGNFYTYFDNLEAVIDTFQDNFDGDDMLNASGQQRFDETGTEQPKGGTTTPTLQPPVQGK